MSFFTSLFSGLDGFSYCMELFTACFLFYVFLKKRTLFWLRLLACAAVLFPCAKWIYPLFPMNNLWVSDIWYGLVFLLMVPVSLFCCDISWEDALFCASCAYLTQHFASSAFILAVFNGSILSGTAHYTISSLPVFMPSFSSLSPVCCRTMESIMSAGQQPLSLLLLLCLLRSCSAHT